MKEPEEKEIEAFKTGFCAGLIFGILFLILIAAANSVFNYFVSH